jgi:hypothetical protein
MNNPPAADSTVPPQPVVMTEYHLREIIDATNSLWGSTERRPYKGTAMREIVELIRDLVSGNRVAVDPATHAVIPKQTPFGLRSVRVEVAARAKEVRSYMPGPGGKSIADALDWVVKDLDGWLEPPSRVPSTPATGDEK